MTYPTAVNDQITDAVTQANATVLGDAPAAAIGDLYKSAAHGVANAAEGNQQDGAAAETAATTATLFSIDTENTGVAREVTGAPAASGSPSS